MKKLICLVLTAAMVLTPTTMAFAKNGNEGKHNQKSEQQVEEQNQDQLKEHPQEHQNARLKEKKQSFKINGAPIIKYGRYKIPLSPITKGMGATATFDKVTAVLTVKKDTTTLVIDLMNKTVTVNGVPDTTSGIFTAKNDKKMTVLIKYIANVLGVRVSVDKDKVTVTVPGLDYATNVTVTPVGGTIIANTLNNTNLALTAAAVIKAGQVTKAELYVGTKLVATDTTIAAADTIVTFTTADDTPVNAELQAAVPTGGVVTVRLYNADNAYVISKTANPTLTVDYVAPTIASAIAAAYSVSGSAITVTVTGAAISGDIVDVTKISLYDSALLRTYQLTSTAGIGSTGVVVDANTLIITLGSADRIGLTGFGLSTMFMNIAAGSLLTDAAGNNSIEGAAQTVPVVVSN